MESTGSPTQKASTAFTVFDDNHLDLFGLKRPLSTTPLPLTTSKFANQIRRGHPAQSKTVMEAPVHELLVKLAEQQQLMRRQKQELRDNENISNPSTATDPYANTPPTEHVPDGRPDAAEVFRLKKQLEFANERMAQMNLALTQSHLAQHTMEQAIGSPFPTAQHLAANITSQHLGQVANGMSHVAGYTRPSTPFDRNNVKIMQQLSMEPASNFPMYGRPTSGFSVRPSVPNLQAPSFTMPSVGTQGQQPPVRTRLSPTAAEFGTGSGSWGVQQPTLPPATYVSTTEPLNYRRLLDRNMNCNWKYIVDKIVCNNDQQASIFLQQKLKIGTSEQKFGIVQAIIDQAYPLMINRFGNFLVQRCFEHGTPEQVIAIAQAIRGNTLNLSMDAFGCHVVQKAFDCVPEEYKAIMVHELLRRIPETVIHRYACHVWQKLFELRWSDSPPQIMKYVNEALRGMWHEVALGETGSLVVQNIFENCLEEDKRPCINEVLASLDVVAHGQFGNWCIQHICEHGSVPDRTHAIDHVLRYATEYSMDQFASKVVEKCLKIGGADFLDRYLERVCEARPDRPRMPLIDIAGDQFGNYIIQYILANGDAQRREIVAAHIRKHMVSLRGSKYGSRVAMLCCNPAYATRPGPPIGLVPSRSTSAYGNDRFGGDLVRPLHASRSFMARHGFDGSFR